MNTAEKIHVTIFVHCFVLDQSIKETLLFLTSHSTGHHYLERRIERHTMP
jgi:hypothetical protein